ncbi:hypothetical protein FEM48_Zijuj01G0083200 [Ziziphus jujuba var. spinosa]|uniref:non-specific serine/threonine protein kinase n=2 Tax=Ziziphus jujuba TaxID=326968 RepID=A0A6P4BGX9_ZIZJJ|nr:hypothetical protein FEM48_Zijuj01G0083200 [Ziziphus jujuba var. spinosa]
MSYVNPDGKEVDPDDEPFMEVDPTGRFGRYKEKLGSGAVKKVFRAFDMKDGKEVAWNQVCLKRFIEYDKPMITRLYTEAKLLGSLKNDNILTSFASWTDKEHQTLNFITEVCSSGNLRDYRKKHHYISLKAMKKWSRQILKGLDFLHSQQPCIIHRDLNCSNVFINGHLGEVKIGDLGLAALVGKSHLAHSILGTPEFMAPELYDEEYTEKVDIYSFGMCVLELVTREIPYSECDSVAKIYKKVSSGVKPLALSKIRDKEVKGFVEKCLAHEPDQRPSASQLLEDSFFEGLDDDDDGDDQDFYDFDSDFASLLH